MPVAPPTVDDDLKKICSLIQKIDNWSRILQSDSDSKFLLDGALNGFKLIDVDVSDVSSADCSYHRSALCPLAGPFLD